MDLRTLEPIRESKHEERASKDLNDVEMVVGTSRQPAKPDDHFIENEASNHSNTNNHSHDNYGDHPLQPLLEPTREHQKPPLAGPEIDDLDDIDSPSTDTVSGVDDGLLEPHDKSHHNGVPGGVDKHNGADGDKHDTDLRPFSDREGHDDVNGFGDFDRPMSTVPGSEVDVNTYQQKKNLAQGMMDLALLSANANQLRYVLDSSATHPYYYLNVVFIALSIIFQVGVGVGLILNSRYNVKDEKDICKADKINNLTVLGVFLITIVNVFITSFSISTPTSIPALGAQVQQSG